jgi:hypothetical protein
MDMKSTIAVVLTVAMLGCGGSEPAEDAAPAPEAATEANQNASAGNADFSAEIAECKYAADASIYNRMASQWHVEQFGDNPLNLTVWRMKDGGATQFSLHRTQGGKTNEINTVEGAPIVGSGTVTITEQGEGVQFDITGKDQGGSDVRARVNCTKLVPLVAEGG